MLEAGRSTLNALDRFTTSSQTERTEVLPELEEVFDSLFMGLKAASEARKGESSVLTSFGKPLLRVMLRTLGKSTATTRELV